ncbi:hypothetical protein NHG29_01840 [Aerococcaceae bacterium NML160702]|nr:hypothetical protein [Aerococcaceae bacterium NML160702]
MSYICLVSFNDKETQEHYEIGDKFNPQGVSEKRMAELLSTFNDLGAPVIRFVEDEAEEVTEEVPVTNVPVDEEVPVTEEVVAQEQPVEETVATEAPVEEQQADEKQTDENPENEKPKGKGKGKKVADSDE